MARNFFCKILCIKIFASQCLFQTYYEFYYGSASQDMAACLTQPKPHGALRQLYIFVRTLRTTLPNWILTLARTPIQSALTPRAERKQS